MTKVISLQAFHGMEPMWIDDDNQSWYMYQIAFHSDGKEYGLEICAKSPDHAQEILNDLKQTGEIE